LNSEKSKGGIEHRRGRETDKQKKGLRDIPLCVLREGREGIRKKGNKAQQRSRNLVAIGLLALKRRRIKAEGEKEPRRADSGRRSL